MSNNYRIYCCLAWKGAISQNGEHGEDVFTQLEALWGKISSMAQKETSARLRFWNSMCVQPQKPGDEPELQTQKPNTLCFWEIRLFLFLLYFFSFFFNFDGWCFVLQWVLMHVAEEQFQLLEITTTTKSNISIFLKKRLQRFQIFLKCFCFILTWHKSFVCILASALWQLYLMSAKWSEKHPLLWVAVASRWQGRGSTVIIEAMK